MTRRGLRAGLHDLAPWIALALLWGAFVCVRHGGLYLASDDAYIYLGYVKRALTAPYELFSYNPGEHSAGVTGIAYYYGLIVFCGLVRAFSLSSSIEADLLLGTFLANTTLLLFVAHLYLRCWRRLTDGGERLGPLALALAFLLFCAQPKWLWAVFAGLEGPLAAALALLILERLLARAPAWQVSVGAALLATTRPETMLLMWACPAFAVLAASRRPTARPGEHPLPLRLGAAYAVACACLAAVILPCYALTGRFYPNALGVRIQLAALLDPGGWSKSLRALLANREYWLSEWSVLAAVIFLAGVAIGLRTRRWAIAWLSGSLVTFLALRGVAGIVDFSVEDRYVSYLWPLYALGIAGCAYAGLRASSWVGLEVSRVSQVLASLVLFAIALALPVRDFLVRTSGHVAAMNAIVVEPARWMRANLPPGARIAMEPAGALRVFTDFYLVDLIGLTTTHAQSYAGNFLDFLRAQRVGFVFDRPNERLRPMLTRRAARDLRNFGRGLPLGDVHLYEVDLSAAITIVSVSARPKLPGRPRAVFDNNSEASWHQLTGGGSGFSDRQPPQLISAEFERSAVVDQVNVALSGPGGREEARGAYRFEGKRDGAWTLLRARARPRASSRDQPVLSFSLAEPVPLEGIRVVRDPALKGPVPVIDELTLLRDRRPWVWLWSTPAPSAAPAARALRGGGAR